MGFPINPPSSQLSNPNNGYVTPQWYRWFVQIQRVTGDGPLDALLNGTYLTYSLNPGLTNQRTVQDSSEINIIIDTNTASFELFPTGVSAGTYGSASHVPSFAVDSKGRLTAAQSYILDTSNITEGTNLYFTVSRARQSISAVSPIGYSNLTGIITWAGTTTDVPEGTNLYFTNTRARNALSGGTGISYNSATGVISLSGVPALNIRTATSTVTASPLTTDYTILCDATSGAITVNLPAAASSANRVLVVKKIDASVNAVTIDPNGAETIDGATTWPVLVQWQAVTFQCDGTAWFVL